MPNKPEEEETFITLQQPAPEIDKYGSKRWYNEKNQLHRENDLPAYINWMGTQYWYKNGILHRENDLPVVIRPNGREEYWENGVRIK